MDRNSPSASRQQAGARESVSCSLKAEGAGPQLLALRWSERVGADSNRGHPRPVAALVVEPDAPTCERTHWRPCLLEESNQ